MARRFYAGRQYAGREFVGLLFGSQGAPPPTPGDIRLAVWLSIPGVRKLLSEPGIRGFASTPGVQGWLSLVNE